MWRDVIEVAAIVCGAGAPAKDATVPDRTCTHSLFMLVARACGVSFIDSVRPGRKIHEALVSLHAGSEVSDNG